MLAGPQRDHDGRLGRNHFAEEMVGIARSVRELLFKAEP